MLKKILTLATVVGVAASGSLSAGAAVLYGTRFSPETGAVTIAGEADGYVTVKIADATIENGAFSDENLPLVFDRIKAEGEFTYVLTLPDNTAAGKYAVYLRDNDGTVKDSFQFFDVDFANTEIIPDLNEAILAADYSAFETAVEASAPELGIDAQDPLYTEKASYITKLLYNSTESFADVAEFYEKYRMMYALAAISGESASEVNSVLKKYAPDLGIDYDRDYVGDTRLGEKARVALCTKLSAYDFAGAIADGKTFLDILDSLKPLSAVVNSSKWQDIQNAMEVDFKDEFKFIFDENSDYDSVPNMRNVYSEMMNGIAGADTLDDVQELFDSAVRKVLKDKENSGSKSPGSGGGGGGGSSVTMPKDDTVLTPVVPAVPQPQVPGRVFADVAPDHWANEAVTALANSNVISGYGNGTFKPDSLITRAEYVKILVSVAGLKTADCDFADVAKDAWYYGYVGAAANAGIAKGSDGKFNPDDTITRQDAATLLYRASGSAKANSSKTVAFADETDISAYASDAVMTLASLEVLNGYTTGEFLPTGNMTRAEVAQMLYKAAKSGLIKQTGGK